MPIEHILIDMDGVLADFIRPACKLVGVDFDKYPPGEWEIAKVAGISDDDFWRTIERQPDFWVNLPKTPHFGELIKFVESLKVRWSISTSPSMDPNCVKQKVLWMRQHIGPRFNSYMIGKQKELMAAPGRVLIDDSDRNLERFERAGGRGILFPAQWNSMWAVEDVMAYVSERLAKLASTELF